MSEFASFLYCDFSVVCEMIELLILWDTQVQFAASCWNVVEAFWVVGFKMHLAFCV